VRPFGCNDGGMNVLANLSATYREFTGNVAGVNEASSASPRVSPYVEMIRILQLLRRHDPGFYQRVQREAVNSLQDASRAAGAALDIRQLVTRRRRARLYWIAGRLNRLAYCLFPGFGEPLTPRGRW
jgi:hypothetical protein